MLVVICPESESEEVRVVPHSKERDARAEAALADRFGERAFLAIDWDAVDDNEESDDELLEETSAA